MKLQHLTLKNFRRLPAWDGDLAPLTLLCGANDVGKSTILKAIYFAFTGDRLDAGKGKDNAGLLLTKGAEHGNVTVRFDGADLSRDIASGKALGKEPNIPLALPYLLRAEQFAQLDPGERRTFLFNVMGVSTSAAEIEKRILAKGIDPAVMGQVKHLLGPGLFAPALTEAERKRVAEKGAWCEVTGHRQYGAKIAAEWKAPSPGYSQKEWDEIQQDLVGWFNIIAEQNQFIGELNAYNADKAKVPGLREQGKQHAALAEQLKQARQQHSAAKAELDGLPKPGEATVPAPQAALPGMGGGEAAPARNAAAEQQRQHVMVCPDCKAQLVYKGAAGLVKYEAPAAAPQQEPEAAPAPKRRGKAAAEPAPQSEATAVDPNKERRQTLFVTVNDLAAHIRSLEGRVQQADLALALADEIEGRTLRPEVAGAAEKLADAQAGLEECKAADRAIQQAKAQTDAAEAKTKRAAQLHASIEKWEALCHALGPDGVQADLLQDALGPLDAELARQAELTGWPRVTVTPDMEVMSDVFPHKMLGKSRGWRTNAMLAVALAIVSGIKIVCLDELDLLNVQGDDRSNAIGWLLDLVGGQHLDSVIVAATLKKPPKLPDEFAKVYWIGGEVVS